MDIEILVFDIDGQRFGIRSDDVVQVLRATSLSPLPGAPESIEGILNLRGCLVPVLDTRRLLGLPAKQMQHTDHLIVVNTGTHMVTLRADHATDLQQLKCDQAESTGAVGDVQLIDLIATTSSGLIHVLAPQRLLADQAIASVVKALAERTATEAAP